jgi:hypothetical protein
MRAQEKFRRSIEAQLEPGETLHQVIRMQSRRWPGGILIMLYIFWIDYRALAVTDRRILVFRASIWNDKSVKELLETLPRKTKLGPVSGVGLWVKITLAGKTYWMNQPNRKLVDEADAVLGS